MGNVDRLLEALAKRLPSSTTREDVEAALRAAVEALPEGKRKTRERVQKTERRCIEQILEQLRAAAALAAVVGKVRVEGAAEEAEDADEVVEEVADELTLPSAYADISSDDPQACLERCTSLLKSALASLRPAKRAAEAMDGLLGLLTAQALSAESEGDFDAEVVLQCAGLAPLASAALCGEGDAEHALIWHRFLAFLLLAPCRLVAEEGDKSGEKAALELAARLGGLVALLASPAAARGAARLAFAGLAGSEVPSGWLLSRLAFAVLPVVGVAFGEWWSPKASSERSDLAALLHSLRMVALCRSGLPLLPGALDVARDQLRAALTSRFDAMPLLPEMRRLAAELEGPRAKSLRKRLKAAGVAEQSRAVATAALAEVVELGAGALEPEALDRLVDFAGLPRGLVDEALGVDARAAAARARGDLFFEDSMGGGARGGPSAKTQRSGAASARQLGGASEAVMAAAAAAVAEKSFGAIEGIEALRTHGEKGQAKKEKVATRGAEEEGAEADAMTPKKGKKRAAPEDLNVVEGEAEALGDEDGGGAAALAEMLMSDDDGPVSSSAVPVASPGSQASGESPGAEASTTPNRTRLRRKSAPTSPS